MVSREKVKDPKKRILMVCVKMFIEKGFKATTMLDIIKEADVSSGTFQNIFKTKDGVLFDLINFMFDNQFNMAKDISNEDLVLVYAIETSIQLAITESNENIREIYKEVYTDNDLSELIREKTTKELIKIFKEYNPNWEEFDFYENEIGSSGIMRAYMARKCDCYFTLKRKIEKFLNMTLKAYNVPSREREEVIKKVLEMDIEKIAHDVMNKLFSALELAFDFKFNKAK